MEKHLVGITKPTTFASAFERETHYNKTNELITCEKVFNSIKVSNESVEDVVERRSLKKLKQLINVV
jgi:hypothetical protein